MRHSSWVISLTMMVLMIIGSSTFTVATDDCLSEEQYQDSYSNMKEELETLKKQQQRMMEQQQQMETMMQSVVNSVSSLNTRASSICNDMTLTNPTITVNQDNSNSVTSDNSPKISSQLQKEFYDAASTGDLSYVSNEILRHGNTNSLDLNWRNEDYDNWTALHAATNNSYAAIVRKLLEAGADPNVGDVYGITPAQLAGFIGRIPVLQIYLEPKYSADVNLRRAKDGLTAVWVASRKGNAAALELLLSHGGDPNGLTNDGDSPLMRASVHGYTEAAQVLINHGANVNHIRSSDGATALHHAAIDNHEDVAKLLLKEGAKRNIIDKKGKTPADMSRGGSRYPGSVARLIEDYHP